MTTQPTCSSCRHWHPPAEGAQGECHRKAPGPMLTLATLTTHPRWAAIWPETLATESCGEWEPQPCRPLPDRAALLRGVVEALEKLSRPQGCEEYASGYCDGLAEARMLLRDEAAKLEGTP